MGAARLRLQRSFFNRNTQVVARELLGQRLVRMLPDGSRLSGIIVEAEAYRPGDAASHAFHGRTDRNTAMYMAPGTVYVYFTYGVHYCLNIVTENANQPAAVLIRSLEPTEGIQAMQSHRAIHRRSPLALRDLCRGPACLCQALLIDRLLNQYDMLQPRSILYIEHGEPLPDQAVINTPRIRVRGDERALTVKWRWAQRDSSYVSR